jgi:hypothetical protein
MENDPNFDKISFAEAFPEKCMPEHIQNKVDKKKAPTKKKAPAKKKTSKKTADTEDNSGEVSSLADDLATEDIPEDPEEILHEDDLDDEISIALSEDATRGL